VWSSGEGVSDSIVEDSFDGMTLIDFSFSPPRLYVRVNGSWHYWTASA